MSEPLSKIRISSSRTRLQGGVQTALTHDRAYAASAFVPIVIAQEHRPASSGPCDGLWATCGGAVHAIGRTGRVNVGASGALICETGDVKSDAHENIANTDIMSSLFLRPIHNYRRIRKSK